MITHEIEPPQQWYLCMLEGFCREQLEELANFALLGCSGLGVTTASHALVQKILSIKTPVSGSLGVGRISAVTCTSSCSQKNSNAQITDVQNLVHTASVLLTNGQIDAIRVHFHHW